LITNQGNWSEEQWKVWAETGTGWQEFEQRPFYFENPFCGGGEGGPKSKKSNAAKVRGRKSGSKRG